MNDELETQLRELGRSVSEQLAEATVLARRESAVRSAMRARQAAELEPRSSLGQWLAELLTPGALAPSAAVCLLLLGLVFVLQETPDSPREMLSPVRLAAVSAAEEDDGTDELTEEIALVGASLVGEFEAEFESEGADDGEVTIESLSFSEDDFDTEEDFSSEDTTETI